MIPTPMIKDIHTLECSRTLTKLKYGSGILVTPDSMHLTDLGMTTVTKSKIAHLLMSLRQFGVTPLMYLCHNVEHTQLQNNSLSLSCIFFSKTVLKTVHCIVKSSILIKPD